MSRPKGTGPNQTTVFEFLTEHPGSTEQEIIAGTQLGETQVKHVLQKEVKARSLVFVGARVPVSARRYRIPEAQPSAMNGTAPIKRSADLQAKIDQLKRHEQIRRDTFSRLMRQLEGTEPETQAGEEETP